MSVGIIAQLIGIYSPKGLCDPLTALNPGAHVLIGHISCSAKKWKEIWNLNCHWKRSCPCRANVISSLAPYIVCRFNSHGDRITCTDNSLSRRLNGFYTSIVASETKVSISTRSSLLHIRQLKLPAALICKEYRAELSQTGVRRTVAMWIWYIITVSQGGQDCLKSVFDLFHTRCFVTGMQISLDYWWTLLGLDLVGKLLSNLFYSYYWCQMVETFVVRGLEPSVSLLHCQGSKLGKNIWSHFPSGDDDSSKV